MVGLKRFEVIKNNYVADDKKKHNKLYPVAIDFKDLTVIVGPNGSGKTQFLKAMVAHTNSDPHSIGNDKEYKVVIDANPGTGFLFFDEEDYKKKIENPAPWDDNDYSYHLAKHFLRVWKSTGEGQIDLMDSIIPSGKELKNYEGIVFAYDEPDHNLDFDNQVKLFKRLKKLSEKSQVIVITHSPVVIAQAGEVFDMGTKQWVNSKEYLGRYGVI